ncbi:MAG TPA: hypothetical protein PKJ41_10530, partial [Bryobacteraceae bacterium]|nr:hypothetical protein [Bryobacteraceae bacterium]
DSAGCVIHLNGLRSHRKQPPTEPFSQVIPLPDDLPLALVRVAPVSSPPEMLAGERKQELMITHAGS